MAFPFGFVSRDSERNEKVSGKSRFLLPGALAMTQPSSKVSIVLPTYNSTQYLRDCLKSCLNQTHRDIELIVVDDGSTTDDIAGIVRSCKDERIRYVKHERNMGLPHALNTGFACATGQYLTWISDDNVYGPCAIEKMLSVLRDGICALVYCDFYRFSREDLSDIRLMRLPDRPALDHNDIGPCFLYSRTVKEVVGEYDPDAALSEDYDYWVRVLKRFCTSHLAEPLYYYREHAQSLSLSRYYDVKIVGTLVKVKNGVIGVKEATESLLDVMSEMYPKCVRGNKALEILFSRVVLSRGPGRKLYSRARKSLRRGRVPAGIGSIVRDFATGKVSFREAKHAITCLLAEAQM